MTYFHRFFRTIPGVLAYQVREHLGMQPYLDRFLILVPKGPLDRFFLHKIHKNENPESKSP